MYRYQNHKECLFQRRPEEQFYLISSKVQFFLRKRRFVDVFTLEGVLVAKKDFNAPKHHEIDVSNLYVIKLMQSMKSRSLVTETFNWQYFYWYLTNEGIEFLRGYLHLPEEIVPATLKKPRTPAARPSAPTRVPGERGPRRERPQAGQETPEGEKKVAAPSADFKPDFVSLN